MNIVEASWTLPPGRDNNFTKSIFEALVHEQQDTSTQMSPVRFSFESDFLSKLLKDEIILGNSAREIIFDIFKLDMMAKFKNLYVPDKFTASLNEVISTEPLGAAEVSIEENWVHFYQANFGGLGITYADGDPTMQVSKKIDCFYDPETKITFASVELKKGEESKKYGLVIDNRNLVVFEMPKQDNSSLNTNFKVIGPEEVNYKILLMDDKSIIISPLSDGYDSRNKFIMITTSPQNITIKNVAEI